MILSNCEKENNHTRDINKFIMFALSSCNFKLDFFYCIIYTGLG